MKISTKGRYALRILVDLAQNQKDGFISLHAVSERQEVSAKYLEMIIGMLNRGGFVKSLRGKNGGYRLAVDPKTCTVGSVLKLTEGNLAPVACLAKGVETCPRSSKCETLGFWKGLENVIDDYVEGVMLADLIPKYE